MSDRKRYIFDLLLLTVVTIWGVNFSVVKIILRSFDPIAFNAVRLVLASAAMALVLKLQRRSVQIERQDLGSVLWLGFLGNAMYQFIFILGLQRTKAGNGALFMALTPIFAYLVGVFMKRERFNAGVLGGIILSMVGVATIVSFGMQTISFGGTWQGDLMMIASAFFWGSYTAESTRLMPKYGAMQVTVLTMIAGTAIILPFSAPWLLSQDWSKITLTVWLGLGYSSLLSLVYSYFIWAYALSRIGVARTAVFANVTPIVALIAGWILLGERPTLEQLAGMALVLTGVIIVRSRRPLAVPDE